MATITTVITKKNYTKRRPIKSWEKDGVNGGPSSLETIIKWLTNPVNFSRWEGSKEENSSCTRESLCSEINRLMVSHGIKHRNNRDIRNRIQNIYYGFKRAQTWIDDNKRDTIMKLIEKGVPTDQIDSILKDKVRAIFSSYYIFQPLMSRNYTKERYNTIMSESSDSAMNGEEEKEKELFQQTPSPPYTQASTPTPTSTSSPQQQQHQQQQRQQQNEEKTKKLIPLRTKSASTPIKVINQRSRQRGIRRNRALLSILSKYMKEKVELEKKRLEIEMSLAETNMLSKKAEAQAALINAWKNLGLEKEEILVKIDKIWK